MRKRRSVSTRGEDMRAWSLFKELCVFIVLLILVNGARSWTQESIRPPATPERIAAELKEIESALNAKAPGDQIGRRWALLGADYHAIGDLQRAEEAYGRALKLLRLSPTAARSYAITLDALASLYLDIGRSKESEICRRTGIAILEGIGDQKNALILRGRLGESLLMQHKYKESEKELSEALSGLQGEESTHAREVVSILLTRAYARCLQHRCADGLADAKRGMEIVGTALPSDSIEAVVALMAMGYALWKTGDTAGGGESMREGLRKLNEKKDITPSTQALARSAALAAYAQYLNETHRRAEAKQVESEIASLKSAPGRSCNGCTVDAMGLSNALR